MPSYGIGLKPEDEGALWSNGIRVQPGPEYPLHFTVGMTGCAFSILLNQYFKYGDEGGSILFNTLGMTVRKARKGIFQCVFWPSLVDRIMFYGWKVKDWRPYSNSKLERTRKKSNSSDAKKFFSSVLFSFFFHLKPNFSNSSLSFVT